MLHPKKVGTLPVEGGEEEKQTNEIKTAIPLLDAIDIQGKTITADALLTQRELARYLVEERGAHYHFTVKGNQKHLLEETAFYFDQLDREPDYTTLDSPDHGRIETRNIWVTPVLNDYLNFPYVGLAFLVERITIDKKSGKETLRCRLRDNQQNSGRGLSFGKCFRTTANTGALRVAITSSTGTTLRPQQNI